MRELGVKTVELKCKAHTMGQALCQAIFGVIACCGHYLSRKIMQIAVRLRHNDKLGRITVPPTVALLRYHYDADSKRARQERVGTIGFWTNELPKEILAKLTAEEQADWITFVRDRNQQEKLALQRFYLRNTVRTLAYASKALQAGEKPAFASRARKAAQLFLSALDDAGFGKDKVARGRPKKDREMDADFLLLETPDEIEHWERWRELDEGLTKLPRFSPIEVSPPKPNFPAYPEGDLVSHALGLAFVED